MEYMDPASRFLKTPFPVEGFAAFVNERLSQLMKPLTPPPYALAEEAAQLEKLHAQVCKDPYQYFELTNQTVNRQLAARQCCMVTRMSDPLLYDCMEDCCAALGFGSIAGYTYEPASGGEIYNAFATGYMDMTWIMLSSTFRKRNLLNDLELACVLGHELGHVAAMHTSVRMHVALTAEENRRQECTADRAGLLAALWRAAKLNPALPPKQLYEKALEASVRVQHKLYALGRLGVDAVVTAKELEEKLADPAWAVPAKEAARKDDHPSYHERIAALREYVQQIAFAECIHTMWGSGHAAALRLGEEAAEHV